MTTADMTGDFLPHIKDLIDDFHEDITVLRATKQIRGNSDTLRVQMV